MERVGGQTRIDMEYCLRYKVMKRVFDILFSLVLMGIFLPFILILSLALLFSLGRPIFFVQKRTGIHNSRFPILKFRTMKISDSQSSNRHSYNWQDGVPDDFQFKSMSDRMVTPVGHILRKYSLDELPQLVNVLLGHMSIVGPRPEIPEITNLYSSKQAKRLLIKPGLTGLAQINGRANLSHGEKMAFDLAYVENRGMLIDLKIVGVTIISVISSKGAY